MWPCAVAGPAPLAPLYTQSRLAHATTLTAQNLLLMLLDLLGGHAQRAFKFSARMTSETSSMFRRSNSIISENRSVAREGGGVPAAYRCAREGARGIITHLPSAIDY